MTVDYDQCILSVVSFQNHRFHCLGQGLNVIMELEQMCQIVLWVVSTSLHVHFLCLTANRLMCLILIRFWFSIILPSLECRYKKLLSSVDLTKDFFYSYTYPIMQSLQKNVLSSGDEGLPYDNMFVWNAYLTHAIRSRCGNSIWTIALVHGHFEQVCYSLFKKFSGCPCEKDTMDLCCRRPIKIWYVSIVACISRLYTQNMICFIFLDNDRLDYQSSVGTSASLWWLDALDILLGRGMFLF